MTDKRSDRARPSGYDVPDQGAEPVVWDPSARRFVPRSAAARSSTPSPSWAPTPLPEAAPSGGRDERRFFVGADAVGKAPPGTRPEGVAPPAPPRTPPPPRTSTPAPPRPSRVAVPAPAAVPRPSPDRPPARPGPEPAAPRRRRRRRVSRARWLVLALVVLPLVLGVAGWFWANATFSRIERVDVASSLSSGGSGTNYLIVGSDSRDGVQDAGEVDGQRSDTMLVLRTEGSTSRMLSIPRDLLVTNAATGQEGRINGAYNQGPANLIDTVTQELGIPIDRYIEVDFVTFGDMVDALGGVTIFVPNPARDAASGLIIEQAGPNRLDGAGALAYVRSRQLVETIDGREVADPTGDLGRVQRQQAFLRAVLGEAGSSRNPLTLMRVAGSLADGLRIDDAMTLTDAVRFAWTMGRLDPESVALPVEGRRTGGGAAVLDLVEPDAEAVLEQFR